MTDVEDARRLIRAANAVRKHGRALDRLLAAGRAGEPAGKLDGEAWRRALEDYRAAIAAYRRRR